MTAPVIRCWKNTDSGGSTTTSLTIDAPSSSTYDGGTNPKNIAAGDLLIILCGNDDSTDTLQWDNSTNKPSGFTLLYTWGNSTIDAHFAVFYKEATGSEGSTIAVPSVSDNEMWASYLCITGWSGDTADLIVDTHNGDGSPPLSIPAITVTDADTLCIALASFDGADSGGFTWTSPYTEQAEIHSGTNPNSVSGTWASRVMTSTGSTGVAEVTYVTTSDGMIGIQFGIPPGAPSSTGDLDVTESGSDTAAISGDVLVDGTLSVTEAASDSPAFTGGVSWPGFTYVYNSSSELLSAPQLLAPGVMPTGPVVVDWANPATDGLVAAYLFRDLRCTNLVNGVGATSITGSPSVDANRVFFGTRLQDYHFDLGPDGTPFTMAGKRMGLIVGLSAPNIVSATDENPPISCWSSSGTPGFLLRYRAQEERWEWYFQTTTGGNSTIAATSSTTKASMAGFTVLGASHNAADQTQLFLPNGTTTVTSATGYTGVMANYTENVYIGATPHSAADMWVDYLHFIYIWDHGITIDFVNEFRRDPYQILVPA